MVRDQRFPQNVELQYSQYEAGNAYGYVGNQPENNTDPLGQQGVPIGPLGYVWDAISFASDVEKYGFEEACFRQLMGPILNPIELVMSAAPKYKDPNEGFNVLQRPGATVGNEGRRGYRERGGGYALE